MGLCTSRNKQWEQILEQERARSRDLERTMSMEVKKDSQIHKLLLLGAGESGKSTIFKQMKGIYGGGWSDEDRKSYKMIVHSNIISSLKTMIEMSYALKQHGAQGTDLKTENVRAAEELRHLDDNTSIDQRLAAMIHQVWWDTGIQRTWDYRSMYYLTDSAAYFLDKVQEVGSPGYIPSEQDVLRSRVRTTGIVENSFTADSNQFKIYDVGGQRNERKKWIHCFSEVTAVLFVVALSGYDMVLYEDQDTNRMHEALDLFEEICNSRYFKRTAMILFMNKRDLFFEKIQQVPLTVCFPEYKEPNDYEHAAAYIEAKFRERNKSFEKLANGQTVSKKIYCHFTCATDTNNVHAVFAAVKDIIVQSSLDEARLS